MFEEVELMSVGRCGKDVFNVFNVFNSSVCRKCKLTGFGQDYSK